MKTNLLNYGLNSLIRYFIEVDEKPFRAKQVIHWMHQAGAQNSDEMMNLAEPLHQELIEGATTEVPKLMAAQKSPDDTRKWLLDVGTGGGVEAVFIPEIDRGTLYISSRVGRTLEYTFCSTGCQGLNHNLTVTEITDQLWWVGKAMGVTSKNKQVVSSVVMMGMGEPMANSDNVITASSTMFDNHGYGLSHRRITISIPSMAPQMDRLGGIIPVALAVSLHAFNDEMRDRIVPPGKEYPLKELMAAYQRYLVKAPRDFVTFGYAVPDGVGDNIQYACELTDLIRDTPCKSNLIPLNPFPHSGYGRSSTEGIRVFCDILQQAGFVVAARKTHGDDIDVACGQLVGQVRDKTHYQQKRQRIVAQQQG